MHWNVVEQDLWKIIETNKPLQVKHYLKSSPQSSEHTGKGVQIALQGRKWIMRYFQQGTDSSMDYGKQPQQNKE